MTQTYWTFMIAIQIAWSWMGQKDEETVGLFKGPAYSIPSLMCLSTVHSDTCAVSCTVSRIDCPPSVSDVFSGEAAQWKFPCPLGYSKVCALLSQAIAFLMYFWQLCLHSKCPLVVFRLLCLHQGLWWSMYVMWTFPECFST